MLRENWRFISFIQRVCDNLFIILAFVLAYYARSSAEFWHKTLPSLIPSNPNPLAPLNDYIFVLIVSGICFNVCLNWFGAYGSMRLRSFWQIFGASILSSAITFIVLAALLFSLQMEFSRSLIGIFCLTVALLLTFERFLVLRFLRYWRRKGRNFRNLIICGTSDQAIRLTKEIILRPELGIGIRAYAALDRVSIERERQFKDQIQKLNPNSSIRLLRSSGEVADALKAYAIDEVIFTDIVSVMEEVSDLIFLCAEQGVRTTLAADLFSMGVVKSGISYFGDMPLIHFATPPGDGFPLYLKRVIDVILSGLLLIILAPLFILISIAVKLTSSGPVFFKQRRMGLNGRIFSMYKFRSMYKDAEQKLAELADKNEMQGPVFKLKNDPRVTTFGKFLRKTSLDELPQLWNVFRGDMSLVGPRPPLPGEVSMYDRKSRRRLSMRPGMTCTWQVSGRNEISEFSDWVKMDLAYIDNWSLWRDIVLLIRTIPVVIFAKGGR